MELVYLRAIALILVVLSGITFVLHYVSLPKIAVISIEGEIEDFHKIIDLVSQAKNDDDIKGVVVRINSFGGTAQACFQAEQAIKSLKNAKPVVVSIGQYTTSGAYLVASPATCIYAYDYSLVGGLGVLAVWVSYEEYLKKEGIAYYVWKSGEMKDLGAFYRRPTEEENQYLQSLVDNLAGELLNRILVNRPQVKDISELREGYVYYGNEAMNKGLVDKLGSFKDAEKEVAKLVKLTEYRLVYLN